MIRLIGHAGQSWFAQVPKGKKILTVWQRAINHTCKLWQNVQQFSTYMCIALSFLKILKDSRHLLIAVMYNLFIWLHFMTLEFIVININCYQLRKQEILLLMFLTTFLFCHTLLTKTFQVIMSLSCASNPLNNLLPLPFKKIYLWCVS